MKSYLKQDNVVPHPPHNIILFELDFNVKFLIVTSFTISKWVKSTIWLGWRDHEPSPGSPVLSSCLEGEQQQRPGGYGGRGSRYKGFIP